MRHKRMRLAALTVTAALLLSNLFAPAISQQTQDENWFPDEGFVLINPTLPNSKLNFDDDSQESCCAKDYTPDGKPIANVSPSGTSLPGASTRPGMAKNEFERSNPRYIENSTPSFLVTCERFANLPELASNGPSMPVARDTRNSLAITSYSTNVSIRPGAEYLTNPAMHNTSDFHIQTAGGSGIVKLQDVNSYSVCMARGNNVAMVANTDNGSLITYNGSDRILMAGNNTNMLTRTGAGEDLIELYQAHPSQGESASRASNWSSFRIYKTAISGGSDTDTLVIKGTPVGTKWCHIGGYRMYGETFHVVEFALPPSVTEGPRRQRINIGQSVEYVVIKGKRYYLKDFLAHGEPVSTVARAIPIDAPLP
jgi:hypothetical protein